MVFTAFLNSHIKYFFTSLLQIEDNDEQLHTPSTSTISYSCNKNQSKEINERLELEIAQDHDFSGYNSKPLTDMFFALGGKYINIRELDMNTLSNLFITTLYQDIKPTAELLMDVFALRNEICIVTGMHFSGMNFSSWDFKCVQFENCTFKDCTFKQSSFRNITCLNCDFAAIIYIDTVFTNCDFNRKRSRPFETLPPAKRQKVY